MYFRFTGQNTQSWNYLQKFVTLSVIKPGRQCKTNGLRQSNDNVFFLNKIDVFFYISLPSGYKVLSTLVSNLVMSETKLVIFESCWNIIYPERLKKKQEKKT